MTHPIIEAAARLHLSQEEQGVFAREAERVEAAMGALEGLTAEDAEGAWARLREAAVLSSQAFTRLQRYGGTAKLADWRNKALRIIRRHAERCFGPAAVLEFPLPVEPLSVFLPGEPPSLLPPKLPTNWAAWR